MTDQAGPGPDALTPQQTRYLARVCERFQAAWETGRPPRIERVLARVAEELRPALRPRLEALEHALRARMQITLEVTAGVHKGAKFTFAGHDTFLVGRSREAHFQLPAQDKHFSRIHFMVEVNPPHCRLTDMKSRNGTYVNDRKVEAADLNHGDKIRAGRSILRVFFRALPAAADETVDASLSLPVTLGEDPARPEAVPVSGAVGPAASGPVSWTALRADSGPQPPPPALAVCPVCGATTAAADPALLCPACRELVRGQPQPIPGYQIVRALGKGGMGVVSLALCEQDGTLVALKTITPNVPGTRGEVDRFLREARILGQLRHEHVVGFRAMGEAGGQLYFAMEYVPGTDAKRILKAEGPLSVGRAVGLVCQVLAALEYAHGQGFVHRDVKPSNVLVTPDGEGESAKLADFGLARVFQSSQMSGLTMAGEMGGTMAFIAPEQITQFRESQPAVDQYAAAATLYNLLTGRFLHDLPKKFDEQILVILQNPPVAIQARRPDVPRDLAAVIHRGLARDPARRFADVGELRRALREAVPAAG